MRKGGSGRQNLQSVLQNFLPFFRKMKNNIESGNFRILYSSKTSQSVIKTHALHEIWCGEFKFDICFAK